jgi:hypothetical protein
MSESRRRIRGVGDARGLPPEGQLVARQMLGTDAVYRVVGENDRGIEVEVVRVPGLRPGSRFTFALEAVLAMNAVDTADADLPRVSPAARPGPAGRGFA